MTSVGNDLNLFHFGTEQASIQSNLDTEMVLRLISSCGGLSGKFLRLSKAPLGQIQAPNRLN